MVMVSRHKRYKHLIVEYFLVSWHLAFPDPGNERLVLRASASLDANN
jgi:hypothetical protein